MTSLVGLRVECPRNIFVRFHYLQGVFRSS